ncbi:unnamed protein product [Fraxinus pennsylvanica]|uniref:Ent-kaurenoic acid oxidase n=1 Tax=Fraxinus pennsylvanica TaxID=56036 RepID=A0AAD1Z8A9_9LAMI|nr:unnamed protein product [Fraxinus pennsylvanica]
MESLEREYTDLNYGIRAMAINIPGFAYHKALKRRNNQSADKKDMMDALMDVEDENGRRLNDDEIIDILVMYLNAAGHESSGHITMWATRFLQKHPDIFKRAKAEKEEIIRKMPPDQKGLTLKEIRQMVYLGNRKAKKDVDICGYTIPQGWKVLIWFRSVHLDPQTYVDPKKFDPSRWDVFTPKAGNFLPFGGGSRLCPGNDLAKLEIAIFLHYFLLNY